MPDLRRHLDLLILSAVDPSENANRKGVAADVDGASEGCSSDVPTGFLSLASCVPLPHQCEHLSYLCPRAWSAALSTG